MIIKTLILIMNVILINFISCNEKKEDKKVDCLAYKKPDYTLQPIDKNTNLKKQNKAISRDVFLPSELMRLNCTKADDNFKQDNVWI